MGIDTNCYGLNSNDLTDDAFPVSNTLLDHEQKKDKTLLKQVCNPSCGFSLNEFFQMIVRTVRNWSLFIKQLTLLSML
jgi:hypothetical protein